MRTVDTIEYEREVAMRTEIKPCPRCNGGKIENDSSDDKIPRYVTCSYCQGLGRVRVRGKGTWPRPRHPIGGGVRRVV